MSKKYSRQEIFNKFIKNRFASQHPQWILELPKQLVAHGYATETQGIYTFQTLPTPNEVNEMLREYGGVLSIAEYERRVKHTITHLGIRFPRSFVIGALIAFLLADALYIGVTLYQRRSNAHPTSATSTDL